MLVITPYNENDCLGKDLQSHFGKSDYVQKIEDTLEAVSESIVNMAYKLINVRVNKLDLISLPTYLSLSSCFLCEGFV